MLSSSGDTFPRLIQKRGWQLGFVTHLLTYLRINVAENMFKQTSFTINTTNLAFINLLNVSGRSGNIQAYKNTQETTVRGICTNSVKVKQNNLPTYLIFKIQFDEDIAGAFTCFYKIQKERRNARQT